MEAAQKSQAISNASMGLKDLCINQHRPCGAVPISTDACFIHLSARQIILMQQAAKLNWIYPCQTTLRPAINYHRVIEWLGLGES